MTNIAHDCYGSSIHCSTLANGHRSFNRLSQRDAEQNATIAVSQYFGVTSPNQSRQLKKSKITLWKVSPQRKKKSFLGLRELRISKAKGHWGFFIFLLSGIMSFLHQISLYSLCTLIHLSFKVQTCIAHSPQVTFFDHWEAQDKAIAWRLQGLSRTGRLYLIWTWELDEGGSKPCKGTSGFIVESVQAPLINTT